MTTVGTLGCREKEMGKIHSTDGWMRGGGALLVLRETVLEVSQA